jgi:hypothetical protein
MKKHFCFVLAFLIVLSCIAASCDAGDAETGENTPKETAPAEEPADLRYAVEEELPGETYGGKTVNVLMGHFAYKDMYAETENGDILNDAVYYRNRAVEELLDIRLNVISGGDGIGEAYKAKQSVASSVKAGDDIYDIWMDFQTSMTGASLEKLLHEFDELAYVDLSKPWWDKNAIEGICFGNKIYFATGDVNYTTLATTAMLLFNKNMFQAHGLAFPYDLVRSGKWTYDEFVKYLANMTGDLDGDGKITLGADQFSLTGWQHEIGPNFYTAMGGSYAEKDEDGMPRDIIVSPKSLSAFEKMISLFSDYGAFQNTTGYSDDKNAFKEGRTLFIDVRPMDLDALRDMEDDFGIIPHPKYDEHQENYRQFVRGVGNFVGVPVSCQNPELSSVVIEALAAESYRRVTPAYFDVVLTIKYTRDVESEDMIEIIADNRVYGIELVCFEIGFVFIDLITKKSTDLVSLHEKNAGKIQKELDQTIEMYGE